MKNDFSIFVFVLLTALVSAAVEELTPKLCGLGLPLLMAFSIWSATRLPLVAAVICAAICGSFEDALGMLPVSVSVSYFIVAAVVARRFASPFLSALVAYPLYQLWLLVWIPSVGGLCLRSLVALPLGLAAMALVVVLPGRFWRGMEGGEG